MRGHFWQIKKTGSGEPVRFEKAGAAMLPNKEPWATEKRQRC